MCLLCKVVCMSLVLLLVIALLISTTVMYEANRVLVHIDTTMSFTFQTLCKKDYHENCLNGGECYVLSMKDEEEAVACMCTSFYGGGKCKKIYVVDVKSQQNNHRELTKKVRNDMFLKQIIKN